MSPSEKNKLYDKYLKGAISKEEMHLLNQYALEDDFLFDALEGAAPYEGGLSMSMDDLKNRLAAKNNKRRGPLYLWLSAAASIAIIIAALVWLPSPEAEKMSDVVSTSQNTVEAEEETQSTVAIGESSLDEEPSFEVEPPKPLEPREEKTTAGEPRDQASKLDKEIASYPQTESKTITAISAPEVIASKPVPAPATVLEQSRSKVQLENEQEEAEIPKEELLAESDEIADDRATAGQNASTISGETPSLRAKKRKSAANYFDLENARESAYAPKRTLEIAIDEDAELATLFQNYVDEEWEPVDAEGNYAVSFNLKKGTIIGELTISPDVNPELDLRIKQFVVKFDKWKGSGNKTVLFRFNKGQ